MSSLEVVAVAATALWLAALSVVNLVLLREIAILRFRLERAGVVGGPQHEGLPIGSAIPLPVHEAMPETAVGVVYVLLTSAICAPCRELIPRLASLRLEDPVVALLAGRPDVTDGLEPMFPPWVRVIRDPQASKLATELALQTTPYALELEFGQITGKAYLHKASDLLDLVRARRTGTRRLVRRPEVTVNVT